jgi:hypothetical protein
MRQNIKNTSNAAGRILSRLVAERKKTVLAVCLISVMAFMWVRVLTKDRPTAAEATSTTPTDQAENGPSSPSKISFVQLPKIPGRHDGITRDFFAPDDWWKSNKRTEGEKLSGTGEVKVVSTAGDQEVITSVAARLKLEAIAFGRTPWAFINGKLLSVGDKLVVKESTEAFECEVVQIEQNMVVIRCRQAEITLKLKRVIEVSD